MLADIPDYRILECAVIAQADLIVTGDHRLLKVKEFERIPLVHLADFLRMIPFE